MAGDHAAGDTQLSVGVVDRVTHVRLGRRRVGRACPGLRDGGVQRRVRLAQAGQLGERVGLLAGRRQLRQLAVEGRHRRGHGRHVQQILRRDQVAAGVLHDRVERGLGAQRLHLERVDGVEQGRRATHRLDRGLQRQVRLLALPRLAPGGGDVRAVCGELQQLRGLTRVAGDLVQGLGGVARLQALQRRLGTGHAIGAAGDLGADPLDDLRRPPRAGDRLGEGLQPIVEKVLGPVAQLDDPRVAGAQLFRGVGDVVVVELVQRERLAEVGAHGVERVAQVARGVPAELQLGEQQLVGGRAQPLVCLDQRRVGAATQLGIRRLALRAFLLAGTPESSHIPILCAAATGAAVRMPGAQPIHRDRRLGRRDPRPGAGQPRKVTAG